MKRHFVYGFAVLATGVLLVHAAYAHTPLCACMDNGDGTVTCEGEFSDGSSAGSVEARIEDKTGKMLIKGKMNKIGEFTFKKPTVPYIFVLDAGPGHVVRIGEKDITH
jgi:hypothetical protein